MIKYVNRGRDINDVVQQYDLLFIYGIGMLAKKSVQ